MRPDLRLHGCGFGSAGNALYSIFGQTRVPCTMRCYRRDTISSARLVGGRTARHRPEPYLTGAQSLGKLKSRPSTFPRNARGKGNMSSDLLPSMIPFMGCVIERMSDGVKLTGASRDHMMAVALTPKQFRPPFTVTTVAKTDSTNLRLYWHVGEVIFNWECSIRCLKVHDPGTGRWLHAENKGFIEVDRWHEIAWEVNPSSMRVLVDSV